MQIQTAVRFQPNLRAIAQMNGQGGIVGRATRNAAETTKQRFQASVNAYGRVDTGQSRDGASVTFQGSNQYQSQFAVAAGSSWWRFQEFGTRWISPAPSLQNALKRLTPGDFHQ